MTKNISWMLERLLQVVQSSHRYPSRFLSLSSNHPKSIKEVSRVGQCLHILEFFRKSDITFYYWYRQLCFFP